MIQSVEHNRRLMMAAHQLYKRQQASCKAAREGYDAGFCLAFLTDRHRQPDPEAVTRALPNSRSGLRAAIILRDYDLSQRERAALGHRLCHAAHAGGHLFLVAGDAHLAFHLRADGVHLPEWQLHARARNIPYGITTAACHNTAAIKRANARGIDAVFISPAFKTDSHKDGNFIGIRRFSYLSQKATMPCYALGGISHKNITTLKSTPASGVAVISALKP